MAVPLPNVTAAINVARSHQFSSIASRLWSVARTIVSDITSCVLPKNVLNSIVAFHSNEGAATNRDWLRSTRNAVGSDRATALYVRMSIGALTPMRRGRARLLQPKAGVLASLFEKEIRRGRPWPR